MPTIAQSEFPPPRSWEEFEDLVWDLYKREWPDPNARRYGRSGQPQQGVDVYGRPPRLGGRYAGIQCKRYATGRLSKSLIEEEVRKAEGFKPALAEFIIATTEQRDGPLQEFVRELDAERRAAEKFGVEIVFWEAVQALLADGAAEDLRRKHYPQFFGLSQPPGYTPETWSDWDTLPEPGTLPPGSRMPLARNTIFMGREDALKALARGLLGDGQSVLVTQAIQGMGGVGKTQLAVEFAWRYGRFFRSIHWVNAAQPEQIGAEIATCGKKMGLRPWPHELLAQVEQTLTGWREGGRRLVVLDNLEDVEAAREWWPRLQEAGVRVIVTARRTAWPRDLGLQPLRLRVFAPQESRVFLREYLPAGRAGGEKLDVLAERLGHLPLALELAGRYLAGQPWLTVQRYLGRLKSVVTHSSMAGWMGELKSATGHDLSVAATFALSWERVKDEGSRRVFLAAAWCAPNVAIPCEILAEAAELDNETCSEKLASLIALGLLEGEAAGPTIHPLVAEYGQAIGGGFEEEGVATLAATLTASKYGGEGFNEELFAFLEAKQTAPKGFVLEEHWPELMSHIEPMFVHMAAMAEVAQRAWLEVAGRLWNEFLLYLYTVAERREGLSNLEPVLLSLERKLDANHGDRNRCVKNSWNVLLKLVAEPEARRMLRSLYSHLALQSGYDHRNVALYFMSMGVLRCHQEDLAGAWTEYEQALAILARQLESKRSTVARAANGLYSLLCCVGDKAWTRGALEPALPILANHRRSNYLIVAFSAAGAATVALNVTEPHSLSQIVLMRLFAVLDRRKWEDTRVCFPPEALKTLESMKRVLLPPD